MKRSHVLATASVLVVAGFAAAHIGQSILPGRQSAASHVVAGAHRGTATLAQSSTSSSLLVSPRQLLVSVPSGGTAAGHLVAEYEPGGGFLDVQQDATVFSSIGIGNSNGRYQVDVTTAPGLAAGVHAGNLQLRMCQDTPCTTPIAGATTWIPYRVSVSSGGAVVASTFNWETFQGNARHDGYVPLTLSTSASKRWEKQLATPDSYSSIKPVVTADGRVYISDDSYSQGSKSIYALSEATGAPLWKQAMPDAYALNPPAVTNGTVYVATTGHEQTFLYAFKASDGSPVFRASFDSQWPTILAPTIKNGLAYTNGGYYGGGVYAFNATDGTFSWSQTHGDDDMSTPAVDDDNVYFYDGTALDVYDAATGSPVTTITDPYRPADDWGYSYNGAPALGSTDHVIAFSGDGAGSWSLNSRRLVDYSVTTSQARWATAKSYVTHPAIAKGVIYAASNDPRSFDAIDEATGAILWQWVPDPSVAYFINNVLVTDNLAFVSSDRAVYAIDLSTHEPVWSSPTPGWLAMSRNATLLIAGGATYANGRLTALRFGTTASTIVSKPRGH